MHKGLRDLQDHRESLETEDQEERRDVQPLDAVHLVGVESQEQMDADCCQCVLQPRL